MAEKILEKLRKLIAHEKSAREIGSMDEAEAFAAKIQQLIDEYNIELSEIGNKPEETRVGSETLVLRTRQSWQKHFLIKLAKFYGCNAIKYRKSWLLVGTQIDRAIVAEFFGTPIVGMGFRISTEVGRMNVDIVWATIAVAALAGSISYGLLALLERTLTFWHPSYRSSRH
mgnify:CR=1 FL=1